LGIQVIQKQQLEHLGLFYPFFSVDHFVYIKPLNQVIIWLWFVHQFPIDTSQLQKYTKLYNIVNKKISFDKKFTGKVLDLEELMACI